MSLADEIKEERGKLADIVGPNVARHFYRSCFVKRRYAHEGEAAYVASERRTKALDDAQGIADPFRHRINHYGCPYCGGWHIGHGQGYPLEPEPETQPRFDLANALD